MDFIITIIEQGLIYGILALGVYITYKILDFPDLTTDGSFPLGGCSNRSFDRKGRKSLCDPSGCFCSRGAGRSMYRTDPCKGKGPGSFIRYYHDDRAVDH